MTRTVKWANILLSLPDAVSPVSPHKQFLMCSAESPVVIVESTQPPSLVYKTTLTPSRRQDSSTPLRISMLLSEDAASALSRAVRGNALSRIVIATIRRFDLSEIEVAVGPAGSQQVVGLRVPDTAFEYRLDKGHNTLHVDVSRKGLPVSNRCGNYSFVLLFYIPVVSGSCVVTTRPFRVASKQPRHDRARPAPKRLRGPSPRACVASSAASSRDALVNTAVALAREARLSHTSAPIKRQRTFSPEPPVADIDYATFSRVFGDDDADIDVAPFFS